MWREQREKAVVGEFALQRFQSNFLQNNIAVRVGEDFFLDSIPIAKVDVDQPIPRHAMLERCNLEQNNFVRRVTAQNDEPQKLDIAWLIEAAKIIS